MQRSITAPPTCVRSLRRALAAAACVLLANAATPAQLTFCEEGGLVVAEIETSPPTGSWAVETAVGGYTGSSYYRWSGPDQFNSPGNGVLTYTLEITTPGDYQMRIRNHHDDPDATMENDVWTRMDGSPWVKTYSKFNNAWVWSTRFEYPDGTKEDAHYVLTAGTHVFQISGRSNDFRIDRVHFYLGGVSNPTDPGLPQSPVGPCGPTDPWADLGGGTAGRAGVPALVMDGPLTPASTLSLDLAGAAPAAMAVLFLSFASTPEPFLGGVLHAFPIGELAVLATDGNGKLFGAVTFPGAAAGTGLWFQVGIVDAGAQPFGAALSNGVRGTVP